MTGESYGSNNRFDYATIKYVQQITLGASGRAVRAQEAVPAQEAVRAQEIVDLTWSGATAPYMDVVRNGAVVTTVPNNGAYTDSVDVQGGNVRYTYKVCEANTEHCSNQVTLRFGGPPPH